MKRTSRIAKEREKVNYLEFVKQLENGQKLFLCPFRNVAFVECAAKGYLHVGGRFQTVKQHNHSTDLVFQMDSLVETVKDANQPSPRKRMSGDDYPAEENQRKKAKKVGSSSQRTNEKRKFTVSDEVFERAKEVLPMKYEYSSENGEEVVEEFYKVESILLEEPSTSQWSAEEIEEEEEQTEPLASAASSPDAQSSSVSEASTTDLQGRSECYAKRLERRADREKTGGMLLEEKRKERQLDEGEEDKELEVEQLLRRLDEAGFPAATNFLFKISCKLLDNCGEVRAREAELVRCCHHLRNLQNLLDNYRMQISSA